MTCWVSDQSTAVESMQLRTRCHPPHKLIHAIEPLEARPRAKCRHANDGQFAPRRETSRCGDGAECELVWRSFLNHESVRSEGKSTPESSCPEVYTMERDASMSERWYLVYALTRWWWKEVRSDLE